MTEFLRMTDFFYMTEFFSTGTACGASDKYGQHLSCWLFYIQGVFFNWVPPISVPKENRQAANHSTGFTGTAAVIG